MHKLLLTLFFILTFSLNIFAENNKITINADVFEIDGEHNQVTASGNVVMHQKDLTLTGKIAKYKRNSQTITLYQKVKVTKGKFILTCEKLIADGAENLIEAQGNVSLNLDEIHAQAAVAFYNLDKQEIRLTGDPVAWQKKDKLTGKEIIIFPEKNKIITKGNTKFILSVERLR